MNNLKGRLLGAVPAAAVGCPPSVTLPQRSFLFSSSVLLNKPHNNPTLPFHEITEGMPPTLSDHIHHHSDTALGAYVPSPPLCAAFGESPSHFQHVPREAAETSPGRNVDPSAKEQEPTLRLADDCIDHQIVYVEETSTPGILMIKLNHGPVNALTVQLMRTLRYYLDLARDAVERRLDGKGVGPHDAPHPVVNPWRDGHLQPSSVSGAEAALADQRAKKHDELVKLFEGVRGLVLSSAVKNVFSAGLDLDELLRVGEGFEKHVAGTPMPHPYYATFTVYWSEFQSLWLTLHTLPIPIVAAINGDAPAGGCIMSMCCDYRVMAIQSRNPPDSTKPPRQYKIGITATRGGFWLPKFLDDNMSWTVTTPRVGEEILTQGLLIPAAQAQSPKYGLVDALSQNEDTVLTDAVRVAERWAGLTPDVNETFASPTGCNTGVIPHLHTYWLVKCETRAGLVSMLDTEEKRVADLAGFIGMLRTPRVHQALKNYRDSLHHHGQHPSSPNGESHKQSHEQEGK